MTCTCDMNGRGKACHCRQCCLTFSGPWAFTRHVTVRGEHRLPWTVGLAETRPGIWGRPSDLTARNFVESVRPA